MITADIRLPGFFDQHPEAMKALKLICDLSPENFLRFTRMAIELREAVHQKALADASAHYRRSPPTEG